MLVSFFSKFMLDNRHHSFRFYMALRLFQIRETSKSILKIFKKIEGLDLLYSFWISALSRSKGCDGQEKVLLSDAAKPFAIKAEKIRFLTPFESFWTYSQLDRARKGVENSCSTWAANGAFFCWIVVAGMLQCFSPIRDMKVTRFGGDVLSSLKLKTKINSEKIRVACICLFRMTMWCKAKCCASSVFQNIKSRLSAEVPSAETRLKLWQ